MKKDILIRLASVALLSLLLITMVGFSACSNNQSENLSGPERTTPMQAPAGLPVTGEARLNPYSEDGLSSFIETEYGASTYSGVHHSAAVNLYRGQTIRLALESDTELVWDENPGSDAKVGLYVLFLELTTYYGSRWETTSSVGIDTRQLLFSNDGKRLEVALDIRDVSQLDSNNQGLYKLFAVNMDPTAAHVVKYTISSYSQAVNPSLRIPVKSAACPLQIGHPVKRAQGVARGWP